MSMEGRGAWRNPQRPYAGLADGTCEKIWSDLYGDMQRLAEMSSPPGGSSDRSMFDASSSGRSLFDENPSNG
jgi:hypothetical protein